MASKRLPPATRLQAQRESIWYEAQKTKNKEDMDLVLEKYRANSTHKMTQIPGASHHASLLEKVVYQGKSYPAIICHNPTSSFTSIDFPHVPAIGTTSDSLDYMLENAGRLLSECLRESLRDGEVLFAAPGADVVIPDFIVPVEEDDAMDAFLAWVRVDFDSPIKLAQEDLTRLSTSWLCSPGISTAGLYLGRDFLDLSSSNDM